ncbi:hypothetical protein R5R35_007048 [Gryllus longicercus]|uniref:Cytochrome P450 n=1 Tax=Gryllus longicercus TaxID=2509291 RepID=A0AAN9V3N8_9ORTH
MGLLFESLATDILVAVVSLCIFISWYLNNNYDYWKKRNVPFCKPKPFVGNFYDRIFFRKSLSEVWQDIYNELEGEKIGGAWLVREPMLFIRDPEIIKRILVKDFAHFQDRGLVVDEKTNPLSAHLFNLGGGRWRALRTKLTPTFTSGKMKMMFALMSECAHEFCQFVSEEARATGEVEFKEVLAKFTTDIIGSCAFGLQFNSMKNPDSEFRAMGRKVFAPSASRTLVGLFFQFAPSLAKVFRLRFPTPEVSDFFLKAVHDTVEYREKNNIKRNDFLQLLIDLKNKGKIEDDHHHHHDAKDADNGVAHENGGDVQEFELTTNLLAAQAFVFFLAGFETSSTTMSFALHELTANPHVQERLRAEIDAVLKETGGQITYEALKKMDYLEMVINESLRKYPPVPVLMRKCNKAYREPETGVLIEEGMRVQIPVYALHRDPKYYPDPERFDPERFSEAEKAKRHHYVFLPFGEGPRVCIGLRFGMLQAKLGLATLLSRYELAPSPRTPHPLTLDPRGFVIACKGGVWVRLTPRKHPAAVATTEL